MNYLKLALTVICLISLNACTDEYLEETSPAVVTTDLDGDNEYFMKGTYNGSSFELKHLNKTEINRPIRGDYSYIGTEFIITNGSNISHTDYDTYFAFAISNFLLDSINLEEVITLGQFDFHPGPEARPQASFKWYLPNKYALYQLINGVYHSRVFDPLFDRIEITEISLINSLENPDSPGFSSTANYGPLYNIKGTFQLKFVTVDNDEPVELIIEEFSAMFQQNLRP